MSRDGVDNSGPILEAAAHWREVALLHDHSVFAPGDLWSEDGFEGLEKYFVLNLDEGEGSFLGKLEGQLAAAPASVKRLAAELTWVMLLCPSNTLPPRKREYVAAIWSWSGERLPDSAAPWLSDQVLDGLGSAGPGYNNHRWRELVFAIRFGLAFKRLGSDRRTELLGDGWGFAEWIERLPDVRARQFRHMLVYLLFPDMFERIFGGGDRRIIVQKFRSLSQAQVRRLAPIQIDRELAAIRSAQEPLHPDEKLDFYLQPLKSKWQATGFEEFTSDIEESDVRAALAEIDQRGVRASAESTIYDLIEGVKRYPPKLVLSLAAKHASGKEFDRALFSGGVDSPAFNLLRTLGFDIERKDVIPELIRKFLAQANAAQSTAVMGYPAEYRRLAIKVSFGKGSLASVPWIAFLGPEQEVQKGIFPVFLYFKASQLLILTKGVSDTEAPQRLWPPDPKAQTVEQYFNQSLGMRAEKYRDSIVHRAYGVPLEVSESQLNAELDELIDEYKLFLLPDLVGALRTSPVVPGAGAVPEVRQPQPTEPYTVTQATEALFMSQETFEQILDVWRRKKNLIVQGPPGVGKTFFYRQLAYALMAARAPRRIAAVQFHPSYSYEDFIQGYRPEETGFRLRDGAFVRFCDMARDDPTNVYVFVIDEINRGNLAKVFGELLMLLEADKRSPEWAVPLSYSGDIGRPFHVPENLYVLGLMNTADRSLAVVDYALRRRFSFVSLEPAFDSPRFNEYLREKGVSEALSRQIIERMQTLNSEIAADTLNLGAGFRIGHSFFCNPPEEAESHAEWMDQVIVTEVAPLLREYYFDDPDRARKLIKRLRSGHE